MLRLPQTGNGPTDDALHLPPGRMALLYMVMLVAAAGNTAMQSVMPSIGTHLGIADVWVSLAFTWSAVLWTVMSPFWARRSDRRGRKTMMAVGMLGFSLCFAFSGLALYLGLRGYYSGLVTILLFALFRALNGLMASASPPAVQAYVASRTGPEARTKALAMLASSWGLGTVIGPALAPFMIFEPLGLVGPFAVSTVLGIAVLIALRLRLPDDDPRFAARGEAMSYPMGANSSGSSPLGSPDDSPDEQRLAEPHPRDGKRLKWSDPRIRAWVATGLLGGHAQSMIMGVIGFLLLDRLGLRGNPDAAAGPIGLVLMGGAITTLLAQWGLIPMFNPHPRSLSLWGMVLAMFGVGLVALGSDLHSIAIGFALFSLGAGLFRPGFTSGASLAVPREEQGEAAGIVSSVNGASVIVAPAVGVWLYNHYEWLAWTAIALQCIAAIAILLCQRNSARDFA